MKEIVKELNDLKLIQSEMDWIEGIPEELYNRYFENAKCVDEGLDVDKHRWYETTISVYKLPEGLIGVESVTDLFSESSSISDIFHTLRFFEMEEVLIPSYKIKK